MANYSFYVWYWAPEAKQPETFRFSVKHEAKLKADKLASLHGITPRLVNSADWEVDSRKAFPTPKT